MCTTVENKSLQNRTPSNKSSFCIGSLHYIQNTALKRLFRLNYDYVFPRNSFCLNNFLDELKNFFPLETYGLKKLNSVLHPYCQWKRYLTERYLYAVFDSLMCIISLERDNSFVIHQTSTGSLFDPSQPFFSIQEVCS